MSESGGYAGRTAIITGGASGIGLALATELVARDARVVIADNDPEGLQRVADRLGAGPGSAAASGHLVDVRDRAAVQALVDEVVARHGTIDLMFNNAGIALGGPTHELTGEHWDRIIDINLGGVVNGLLAAYPQMVAQGHGHIVNTASGAGLAAPPLVVPYAATKHAVVGLSTGLRPEAARHGVRVSVLCPGAVETPILDRPPPRDLPATATAPVTARRYLQVIRQHPMPADRFARAALTAIDHDRAVIVLPRRARALWYLQRLSPALTERISGAILSRVNEQLLRPTGP